MSAAHATGDKRTAAIHAGWPGSERVTVKRRKNTARQQKAKSNIAEPKTVADTGWAKKSIEA
jgi:hypothetical protein